MQGSGKASGIHESGPFKGYIISNKIPSNNVFVG
jgi:hypothetical protein